VRKITYCNGSFRVFADVALQRCGRLNGQKDAIMGAGGFNWNRASVQRDYPGLALILFLSLFTVGSAMADIATPEQSALRQRDSGRLPHGCGESFWRSVRV
jgi:hypothetical protein